MAGRFRKLLAVTAIIAGVAWVLPTYDDGVRNEDFAGTVSPEFEIQVRRSRLYIAGHAASAEHEEQLRRAVAAAFPAFETRYHLRALGMVPDWWSAATAELVAVLATMSSPSARLDEESLQVRGVVADDGSVTARLGTLGLPESVAVSAEFARVEPGLTGSALCQRQFDNFAPAPIRFEESLTVFRNSAYAALDRVATLADDCRDALLTITGHTDSSGDPAWNRRLSLLRAQAVAAYLERRGIDAARMMTAGAGSATPVADNDTRHGRSLNRRIEIAFSAAD